MFRAFLALGLSALFTLLSGVESAHALESTSFRLEGALSTEVDTLTSTSFTLRAGLAQGSARLAGASSGGEVESSPSSSEETGGGSSGGGGGRRARPVGVSPQPEVPRSTVKRPLPSGTQTVESGNIAPKVSFPATSPRGESPRKIASEGLLARRVIQQPSLRPIVRGTETIAEFSLPSIDLSPLVALTVHRRMIASAPLRFQDSWHRPRGVTFFGAELAEAYETYRENRSVRVARLVDLINQNLLLSATLVFAAVMLSVLGTSPAMRRKCTTIVCVLERQIAAVQPRMGYARLLLRVFLLVFSLGIFFWLTTAYAFAATTTPLRHAYNGRLLNSAGTALSTAHTIRFSYWTSADHVAGDTTGTGAIHTGASTYAGWNEVHTVTPNSDGYFNVELGSVTALPTMDSLSLSSLLSLFLQVEVKASSSGDTAYELLDRDAGSSTVDRSPVLSTPFALNADMLDQRDVGTGSGSIPLFESGGVLAKSALPSGLTRDIFTIDSDDSALEPTLRFGDTLAKTLSHTSGSFRFSDDLVIAGSLTVDQDLATGTGFLVDSEALNAPAVAIDIQGSSTSPHILFGSGGTFDTALFRDAANTLRLSGSFYAAEALSGATLKADRALASSGTLNIAGATTLGSTLSGASTVTLSVLKNCAGLGTNVSGTVSCATTPVLVRKSTDETVNNSATLQDDDALRFAIGANETWAFTMHVVGQSRATPDFKFALTAPLGSMCTYSMNAEENAKASSHVVCGDPSPGMPGNGVNEAYFVNGTVITAGVAGTVTLQWSQFTADPSSSIVRAGSWLIAHKIS